MGVPRYGISLRLFNSKRNSISTSSHVLFCLLYKHTNDDFLDDFPKISNTFRRFPRILQKLSEGQTNVSEHFPKMFGDNQRHLRIIEDFRGRTDDVSIIQQRT